MPNYEELYHLMINAAEDAISQMDELNVGAAKQILIAAEQKAEEMYVSANR